MKKIRINELARELEVKPNKIIESLSQFGVTEKKTHSSSIEVDVADKVRRHLRRKTEETPSAQAEPSPLPQERGPVATAPPEQSEEPTPADVVTRTEEAVAPQVPDVEAAPPAAEEKLKQRRAPHPIRPPLATTPTRGQAPSRPAAPTKARPTSIPAKPLPTAPRPGQILSGPRQPFPSGVKKTAPPSAVKARPPQSPAARTVVTPPSAPERPQQQARPPLAGQPAARPVVPPRPDLVARLAQKQTRGIPGQPQAPRPSSPGRPQTTPIPGQPIYRGPIRPGQTLVARPGSRSPRSRTLHPTSTPMGVGPGGPTPIGQRRGPDGRRGARTVNRDRAMEREEKNLHQQGGRRAKPFSFPTVSREVTIVEGITVKELSEKLGVKANMVIKKLVERKIFATINQTLDVALAEEIAKGFGATTSTITFEEEATQEILQDEAAGASLTKRAPVVTVMGHVDHGKTSLLDALRSTNVAGREAGGITQHIGAYEIEKDGRKIVFIDTPGHEAFTRMRSRGAKVTDLVVLVVAADDGVMPQTLEAIDHARAAKVPIIVAVNKIDKPDAQPDRVKQQLADRGLLPEDWGGETVFVNVSAKAATNLELLLEMILLVSDMLDLKASPDRPAVASVLEAKLDRGRGPVATILMQNGTIRVGDYCICGPVFGKVRAMFNDRGQPIRSAGPATPVELLGMDSLPEVGDAFQGVTDTAKAKQIVIYREAKAREQAMAKSSRMTLDQLHEQMKAGEVKELSVILKADVGGTAEVLSETLQKLSTDKVKIRVLHSGVGAITETDVLLASASNAVIIGFNVRPERNAAQLAEQEKVDVRLHTIIYELTDELKRAMTGLLEPVYREVYRGRAEVRDTFRIPKIGMVAGCQVLDGTLNRSSQVRILRDNIVVHTGKVGSLRRFKDDVSEVRSGMECGLAIENFGDVKPGDIVEVFVTERVATEALV